LNIKRYGKEREVELEGRIDEEGIKDRLKINDMFME
jgi:hypothetical protein